MIYLSERDIVKLNVIQIKRYSPKETIGVIDKNAFEYGCKSTETAYFLEKISIPIVFSKAAVLLINLIKSIHFTMLINVQHFSYIYFS